MNAANFQEIEWDGKTYPKKPSFSTGRIEFAYFGKSGVIQYDKKKREIHYISSKRYEYKFIEHILKIHHFLMSGITKIDKFWDSKKKAFSIIIVLFILVIMVYRTGGLSASTFFW